jgi:protein O-GlcNAc transferase
MPELSIEQALDLAVQHHQAGRLLDAEHLYRQILAHHPQHADAMHLLGVIAQQVGRADAAVELIRHAIVLRPEWPEALSNLGNALRDNGQLDDAVAAYRQAISLKADYPEAFNNLGTALRAKGQFEEAISCYRRAILLNPSYAEAHSNLGDVLREAGNLDEAILVLQQAIHLRPNFAEAHSNLGNALKETGELDQAIANFRTAIQLKSSYAEAHGNLGEALRVNGQIDAAIAACRQAINLNPNLPEAHNNLGNALRDHGQLDEAVAAYQHAIALRPRYAEAYRNLGNALRDCGRFDQAIDAFEQAIVLNPNYAKAISSLGNALKDLGKLDAAIAAYRQAVRLDSTDADVHSNLVFSLNYDPQSSAQSIAEELWRWDQQHAQPLAKFIQPHTNSFDPARRLRIGYVSPDFREHVVARNLLPLFSHHDHQQFEVICYSQVPFPDAMTQQYQRLADGWRNIVGLSDEQLALQIRKDRIDILVDLALHTASNRLRTFARKPAPVQVTFAGYPGSTGLSVIDYRLSDPYLDPVDMDESVYSEKTIRLANSFWCYDPLEYRDIETNPLPALDNGFINFGCLNNFCKVNKTVLGLWAKVMQQVENSQLLLLAPPARQMEFALEGIDPSRIKFIPTQSRRDYLRTYNRIDVGLDTFPYNGHTTSLDSLWMGVPVVTLVGNRSVARAGWCQLSNLGLQELAGHTIDQ